jgi:hypothetical protein
MNEQQITAHEFPSILVVEDEQGLGDLIRKRPVRNNFNVQVPCPGENAVKHVRKRILVTLILLLLLSHLNPLDLKKNEEEFEEYQTKAVFLSAISKFIEWPEESGIKDKSKHFVIAVIGENPFVIKKKRKDTPEDWLIKSYKDKKIKGKKVEIRYISEIKDIPGCHILFVSDSMKKDLPEIIETARQYPILTIADTAGFAKKGIYINLFIEGKHPKYEVNETAIRSSGLEVSFPLLQYGKRVNPIEK